MKKTLKFSEAERKNIYLLVAEIIEKNPQNANFVCTVIERMTNILSGDVENEFPELFLFREPKVHNAFLTSPTLWGLSDKEQDWMNPLIRQAMNENKLTVLYLCAEMCE